MSADMEYAQVDRRRGLSLREFRHEYLYPGRPVVIEDAIDSWKNDVIWSFEALRDRCGSYRARVYHYDRHYEFRPGDVTHMDLRSFITRTLAGTLETFPYYLRDEWKIFHAEPELMRAHAVPPYFFDWFRLLPKRLRMPYPRLFIGPCGAITPLHVDVWGTHAWLSQLVGRKRWLLFSPEQTSLLYDYKVRCESPDYERQPLYRQAQPRECVIGPGDTIFVPSRWSHWVHSLDPAISITYNYMGPGCFGSCLQGVLREQTIGRLRRSPAAATA